MTDRPSRLTALRDTLASCEAEADDLGLETVGFLLATALQELNAQTTGSR